MTCAQLFNSMGLVLGMLGVALIFVWGPPQPQLDEGVDRVLEDDTPLENGLTVAQYNMDVRKRRLRHKRLSRIGLVLVFIGFFCQFLAVWS